MIVASLLLILVAVTLLVLGLTGGSSGLLISSIVASLLAAVALVIGARQNASARRAAAAANPPTPDDLGGPEYAAETAPAGRGFDDFASVDRAFADESAESDLSDRRETVQLDAIHDDDIYTAEDEAFAAGRRDAEGGLAADEPLVGEDPPPPPAAEGDQPAYSADYDTVAEPDDAETDPDYGRAADAINAARSENPDEDAWRRADAPAASGPAAPASAEAAEEELDFAEPDEEDPADEPLPQAVSPSDAVRVARLDAEVLVVDGRPRYHLPDCPHLVGRLTEPIPVNEAVELGFSPCGLCRPVDRLVAAAARR